MKKRATRHAQCCARSNWHRGACCERGIRIPSPESRVPAAEQAMILVIDNYDSFTYNLVQYLGELGAEVRVKRNNEVTIGEIETMGPEQILISPGPGRPENAGITPEVIRRFGPKTPILGVC